MRLANELFIWKRAWDVRVDPDFEVDKQTQSLLRRLWDEGTPISDETVHILAAETGRPLDVSAASFQRMIEFGVLRPKVFSPPRPTVFRMTNKPVTRLPLHGYRRRLPRGEGQKPWGRPIGSWSGHSRDYRSVFPQEHSATWMQKTGPVSIDDVSDDRGCDDLDLDNFVSGLHPVVANLCRFLGEGMPLEEARTKAGLSKHEMELVLPRLKAALAEVVSN